MKKLSYGIITVLGLVLVAASPASACLGPDGKPVEGTDGAETNCLSSESSKKTEDHFSIDSSNLDFGQITELDRSYTKQIVISNNTDNDIIIDATIEEYTEAGSHNKELAEWLAFVGGVSHFSVAKGATYNLSVRAVVPSDAKAGSQYATVKMTDASGYSLEALAKMNVASEKLEYDSEVSGEWIDPFHIDEKLSAHATVKNTGPVGFSSTYQVKAKSFFGGDWEILQESTGEVMPGREYSFSDSSVLGYGIYNVEQRVTYAKDGRMVENLITRTVVNLPWWALAAAGGVILLIIIIVIVRKKKGKKHEAEEEEEEVEKAPKVTEDVVEEIEEEPVEDLTEEPVEEPVEKPAEKPKAAPVKIAVKKPVAKKPAAKPSPKRIKIQ